MSYKRNILILFLILILAIVAGIFDYPKLLGSRVRPWKLGLDLVGGSYLIYEVDMANVQGSDQNSVIEGLKDVIEKRVNLFGVSEPQVYISKSGNSHRLVVELAGIKDVNLAIKEIGETPLLEFREV